MFLHISSRSNGSRRTPRPMSASRALKLAPLIRRIELRNASRAAGGLRGYTTGQPAPQHGSQLHHNHHDKHAPTRSQAVPGIQRTSSPVPTPPGARHEVHEGTSALSAPYNPPGGGPSAGPGIGGSGFSFTNSPVLDAMITTAIGLGAGMSRQ